MDNESEPTFRVVYSAAVRKSLKEMLHRAVAKGIGQEVLQAVRTIDQRLALDPLTFGDPWYDLTDAKLKVMSRIVRPLFVVYGVHKDERVVFVRDFQPFPSDVF